MLARRTKIVATLGPATDTPGVLDRVIAAGLDCARLNCSHGTQDELRRRAAEVRAAGERAGRRIGVLFDLQGPKLRLAADTNERDVAVGELVELAGSDVPRTQGRVAVEFAQFADLVTERSQLVIGDGVPRMLAEHIEDGIVRARVLTAGRLIPRKGINVTYARPELPAITEKDIADLQVAVEADADFVALSFVRSAADVEELSGRLRAAGSRARTIAKIEKVEAYEHLDEIINVSDGVMVARGDYGVEAGVARVPLMQKDTIWRATQAGKTVITATQMLESMIGAPEPTRAEAADVANAVIDGTSAVMLSAETSIGAYPGEAVLAMAQIAEAAEEAPIRGASLRAQPEDTAAAVMQAAIQLADDVYAEALVVPTSTGGTVRACAKYRRKRPVVALAHDPKVAAQLTLEWGVTAATVPLAESVNEMIDHALVRTREVASLESGARVLVTAGPRTGTPGATNLIMLREIP
jgi:pyruvate kinase